MSTFKQKVAALSDRYQLSPEMRARFQKAPAAKIINALPTMAGYKDADRIAFDSLDVFIRAYKMPEIYSHKPGQTTAQRLRPLAEALKSERANPLIQKGLTVLEMISLNDHNTDRQADKDAGKFNPLNAGQISYKAEKRRLRKQLFSLPKGIGFRAMAKIVPTIAMGFFFHLLFPFLRLFKLL